jgi:hypothetical protein
MNALAPPTQIGGCGDRIVGPALLDHAEVLIRHGAPLVKGYSQRLELLPGPAHADA